MQETCERIVEYESSRLGKVVHNPNLRLSKISPVLDSGWIRIVCEKHGILVMPLPQFCNECVTNSLAFVLTGLVIVNAWYGHLVAMEERSVVAKYSVLCSFSAENIGQSQQTLTIKQANCDATRKHEGGVKCGKNALFSLIWKKHKQNNGR